MKFIHTGGKRMNKEKIALLIDAENISPRYIDRIMKEISKHGIIYIINSLIFMICALTLAFLIGNIVNNKTAINGIINVVALGSSFLCGAFVPMEWLPDSVLKLAHIFPTYWYIKTNELLKTMEVINFDTLKPIIMNMIVILGFMVIFVFITNVVSNKKRKID